MERFGKLPVIGAGMTLAIVGYALFLPLGPDWTYLQMLPTILLVGVAFALTFGTLMIVATDGIAEAEQGLASGLQYVSLQFGAAVGLAGFAWFGRVVLDRADFRQARGRSSRSTSACPRRPSRTSSMASSPTARCTARYDGSRSTTGMCCAGASLFRRALRREIAAAIGVSVYQYEKRHARAWSALVHVVAADEPTPRCRPVRRSRVHVEAHLLECLNCRLALMGFVVPSVNVTVRL